MANSAITIRIEDTDIRVGGRRITDFPQAGTFFSSEKVSPNSTPTEGMFGSWTTVRSNGGLRTVSITVLQHSGDDAFLAAAIVGLNSTNKLLPVSAKYGSFLGVSGGTDVQTEPTRELAGDSSPNVVYVFTGVFPVFNVFALEPPELLTEDEINDLIPPSA